MIEEFNINFSFKAERNYVHGTDIYNALYELLAAKRNDLSYNCNIDMSLHKISTQHMKGQLVINKEVFRNENTSVFFTYKNKDKVLKILLEENGEPVTSRYNYNEKRITENTKIDLADKAIVLYEKLNYSFIEIIVALNKELLNQLYPGVEGKWYFTRVQLNRFDKEVEYEKIDIKFQNNFNLNLVKSSIYVNKELVGSIYFSLVKV